MPKNAIWIFMITLATLVILLPAFSKMQELRQKNADYQEKIVNLKVKNTQLMEERHLLQNDPLYLEKVAREKMGLARQGEVVYRITPASGEKK